LVSLRVSILDEEMPVGFADVNIDGNIDVIDLVRLKKIIANK
jgi:hypothetical protein